MGINRYTIEMSLQDGLTESNSELINMKSWVEKELLNQKNKPDSFIGPFGEKFPADKSFKILLEKWNNQYEKLKKRRTIDITNISRQTQDNITQSHEIQNLVPANFSTADSKELKGNLGQSTNQNEDKLIDLLSHKTGDSHITSLVKVNTLNKKGKLNIRDMETGKAITKLDNGTQLIPNVFNTKMRKGKLCIEVKTINGGYQGYVAADYLKLIKVPADKNSKLATEGNVSLESVRRPRRHATSPSSSSTTHTNMGTPEVMGNFTGIIQDRQTVKKTTITPPTSTINKKPASKINKHADKLSKHADKLSKHADKLSKHADKLSKQLSDIQKTIQKAGLKLDIISFKDQYMNYIDDNLSDFEHVETLKKIVTIKLGLLGKIIQERIDWVDEQIEEGDYKQEDRLNEIKNQRWIINHRLQELFKDFDNKVLPTALILTKKTDISGLENIEQLETMFNAELTDDGDFNQSMLEGIYDGAVNNWHVLDFEDEDHNTFLQKNSITKQEETTLLEAEDIEIEKSATFTFYGLLALQIGAEFTPIGWTLGAGIDGVDMFSDEEVLLTMARNFPWVNPDYKMEKTWIDNALAGVGLIPGMTVLTKGDKLHSFLKKMGKEDKTFFMQTLNKISQKMGIGEDKLKLIKDKVFGKVDQIDSTPKGTFLTSIKDSFKTSSLSFINKNFRKLFKQHDFDAKPFILTNNTGETLSIIKEAGRYKINGGSESFSYLQVLKNIPKEYRINKLINKAEADIDTKGITKIGIDKYYYKPWRNKIQILEGGKIQIRNTKTKTYKDVTGVEKTNFFKENPDILRKVLQKDIDGINKLSNTALYKRLLKTKVGKDLSALPKESKDAIIAFMKTLGKQGLIGGLLGVGYHQYMTDFDEGTSIYSRLAEIGLAFVAGFAIGGGTFAIVKNGIPTAWKVIKGAKGWIWTPIKIGKDFVWKKKIPIGLATAGYIVFKNVTTDKKDT